MRVATAAVLAALGAGSVAGALLASGGPGHAVPAGTPLARALESSVLRVATLEENLGAPAPPGAAGASWALAGVGARGPVAHLRLARPGRAWVRPDGAVAYLDGAEAAAILASQSREVRAVASGALRAELLRELAAIVAGERRSSAGLSSPGGARPVRWLSVTRAGGTATVDGYVATWVEQTSVRRLPGPGERHVASESVSYAEVEALASLASSGGTWRVVSLAEKPYQQAT